MSRLASELLQAAADIQSEKELTSEQAGIGLRMFNADSSKSIKQLCPWIPGPTCDRRDMFRRYVRESGPTLPSYSSST